MRVAAVNWKLREIAREEEFYEHLRELLDWCKGCDVVVFPELFCLELIGPRLPVEDRDLPAIFGEHLEAILDEMDVFRVFNSIGFMAAGSVIYRVAPPGSNSCLNMCMTYCEGGGSPQYKVVLTEWEKEIGVKSGSRLMYRSASRCGVTICLDAEFPASGRALAEAGMLFQCVPAWTETMHGFQRVRWACQARAVENQVCVIHSSLVGKVGKEESHGSSAIIVPPHLPFPLNPILAETPMDEEGVAIAEVDPADLLKCREQGDVRNWRDRDAGDWTVTIV